MASATVCIYGASVHAFVNQTPNCIYGSKVFDAILLGMQQTHCTVTRSQSARSVCFIWNFWGVRGVVVPIIHAVGIFYNAQLASGCHCRQQMSKFARYHLLATHFHQHSGATGPMTAWCECRAYDSSLDFPTPTERHVYPTVLERAPVPMQAALRPLLPASAFQPRLSAPAVASGKLRGVPVG